MADEEHEEWMRQREARRASRSRWHDSHTRHRTKSTPDTGGLKSERIVDIERKDFLDDHEDPT